MSRASKTVRSILAAGVAVLLLPAAGCKDQRAPTGPGDTAFLDGDTIFDTAIVTTSFLRYMNDVVETARVMVVDGIPQIRETGCSGNGERLFARDLTDPNRVTVRHGNSIDRPYNEIDPDDDTPEPPYIADCNSPIRLTIGGYMILEFQDTSAGALRYTIEMPMAWSIGPLGLQGTGRGMVFQLPADFGGGAILDVTTPGSITEGKDLFFDEFGQAVAQSGVGGHLECVQEGSVIRMAGAMRVEERVQRILLVEDLDVTYAYDAAGAPPFAAWPGGSYELGTLAPNQFFGASVTPPFDVFFDGFGGVSFPVGDRTCDANMLDLQNGNPCSDR